MTSKNRIFEKYDGTLLLLFIIHLLVCCDCGCVHTQIKEWLHAKPVGEMITLSCEELRLKDTPPTSIHTRRALLFHVLSLSVSDLFRVFSTHFC